MTRTLLLIALLLSGFAAQAQFGLIGMDQNATPASDTVIVNTQGHISGAVVNNDSTSTYAGELIVALGVNLQGQWMTVGYDTLPPSAMLPGETTPFALATTFSTNFFYTLGLNSMAMWPIGDSVIVTDSVFFELLIVPDPLTLLTVTTNSVFPDPVPFGSQLSFDMELFNNSIITAASPIDIKIGVSNSNGFTPIPTNFIAIPLLTIPAQTASTQSFTDVDVITTNGFEEGGNIVLIWPEAPTGPGSLTDSLMVSVEVTDTVMAVGEVWSGFHNVQLFPNPSNGIMQVNTGTGQPAQAVIVSDLTGKTMQRTANTTTISLEGLPAGVYIVTVVVADNKVRPFRVVRNEHGHPFGINLLQ